MLMMVDGKLLYVICRWRARYDVKSFLQKNDQQRTQKILLAIHWLKTLFAGFVGTATALKLYSQPGFSFALIVQIPFGLFWLYKAATCFYDLSTLRNIHRRVQEISIDSPLLLSLALDLGGAGKWTGEEVANRIDAASWRSRKAATILSSYTRSANESLYEFDLTNPVVKAHQEKRLLARQALVPDS